MDEFNKKVLMTSYLIIGMLTGLVVSILLQTIAVSWSPLARVIDTDLVRHGIPVGVGLLVFVILQTNKRIATWGDEVVHEIRKVVWPTKQQTVAATIYVCFFVLISGAAFGVFDFVSGYIFNKILN